MVLTAFTHALNDVFLVCIPFIIIALIVAVFLKEIPLRSGVVVPKPQESREDQEATLAPMGH